jgi:hypothetical protein
MLKILDHLEESLIAVLMGAATLLVFVAVIHRYAAGWPIPVVQDWLLSLNLSWAQELCIYMFIWMAKFGAAYGVRTGIHVGAVISSPNRRRAACWCCRGAVNIIRQCLRRTTVVDRSHARLRRTWAPPWIVYPHPPLVPMLPLPPAGGASGRWTAAPRSGHVSAPGPYPADINCTDWITHHRLTRRARGRSRHARRCCRATPAWSRAMLDSPRALCRLQLIISPLLFG